MHRIVDDRTGAAFDCAGDDAILRAGLRAGLALPYECNVGGCGSCKFELLAGEIAGDRADLPGLSPRDRQRGRRLACQARPLSDCRIRMLGRGEAAEGPVPRRLRARLVAVADLTHDMREFRFVTERSADFRPGQYALLSPDGLEAPRAYSMSNLANPEGEWHFVIRHVPQGEATSRLFDLCPGAEIAIDGPYGLAFLRAVPERDIVCIAGGSGLSPMLSIARGVDADAAFAARNLHFVYGGRAARDICGESLLRSLPRIGSRLRFHPIVSAATDGTWTGRTGLVHEVLDELLAEEAAGAEYYLAGPPPMTEAVLTLLTRGRAVPSAQIHYDRFF